jgi:hypothetical protein
MAISDFKRLHDSAEIRDHAVLTQARALIRSRVEFAQRCGNDDLEGVYLKTKPLQLIRTAKSLVKASSEFRDRFAEVAAPMFRRHYKGLEWEDESCPMCGSPDCLHASRPRLGDLIQLISIQEK